VGFEPTVAFTTHDFQSCRFGRSRTPPWLQPGQDSRPEIPFVRQLTWKDTLRLCWVRWPGPAQRSLVNRVRAGRQQLSAGLAVCRSQPGRRTEHRRLCHRAPVGSAAMADAPFVSLYRRFRPGRFEELRGQDHVVRALQSAVRDDRVSHAYLFSGPRGTGKTSSARILAKALNCAAPVDGEPCGVCTSCVEITQGTSLNVHELDAASNNGVDAMRDLVAHAGLGTPGRWKVYIVDEVHMLSTAAANALLKTLEEPPSHVVFVLATTDPQKVPPTIRSRTQHLEFRLIGADTLQQLLESVKDQAGLQVDGSLVAAAVRRARGSARDALSALDQVAASGTADSARPDVVPLVRELAEGEVNDLLVQLSGLLAGGWGPQPLVTELIDELRQVFLAALAPELCSVAGETRESYSAMAEAMGLPRVVRTLEILGRALIDLRDAPDAQVVLEIALVRASRPELDAGVAALSERVAALERSQPSGGLPASAPPPAPVETMAVEESGDVRTRPSLGAVRRQKESSVGESVAATAPSEPVEAIDPVKPTVAAPRVDRIINHDSLTQAWGDVILRALPARAKALYAGGRFVTVDDGGAQFALPNAAHRDRCAEMTSMVEGALSAHFGSSVNLVLIVDDGRTAVPDGSDQSDVATGKRKATPAEQIDEADQAEVDELMSAAEGIADQASDAEARLLEAFPGTSEVIS
jgi:DNA polymerase III subunit gamma/tau